MRSLILFVALATAFAPHPAHAEARDAFSTGRISDVELAGISGAGSTQWSRTALASDDQQASLFRQTADVGRIIMDNWWSQQGAVLIANSVATGLR